MKKTLLALILAGFALTGCDQQTTQDAAPNQPEQKQPLTQEIVNDVVTESALVSGDITDAEHNARNTLDWNGTYTGTLPCADCEGINTELVLNKDGTYTLTETYLGQKDATFDNNGTFSWNPEGNTIVIPVGYDNVARYFVGENELYRLDQDGNRVSGDLAAQYTLKKQ